MEGGDLRVIACKELGGIVRVRTFLCEFFGHIHLFMLAEMGCLRVPQRGEHHEAKMSSGDSEKPWMYIQAECVLRITWIVA